MPGVKKSFRLRYAMYLQDFSEKIFTAIKYKINYLKREKCRRKIAQPRSKQNVLLQSRTKD